MVGVFVLMHPLTEPAGQGKLQEAVNNIEYAAGTQHVCRYNVQLAWSIQKV